MRSSGAIKLMCKHCYMVRRGKKRFVYCKVYPKHKQRQGFHTLVDSHFMCCGICGQGNTLMTLTPPSLLPSVPSVQINTAALTIMNNDIISSGNMSSYRYDPAIGLSQLFVFPWNYLKVD